MKVTFTLLLSWYRPEDSAKLRVCHACVLTCTPAQHTWVLRCLGTYLVTSCPACIFGVLPYLRACVLNVLARLCFWWAYDLAFFTCYSAYVFTRLASLLVLRPYVLTCLVYCAKNILRIYMLDCFFDNVCRVLFSFKKLNSQNYYTEKQIFV